MPIGVLTDRSTFVIDNGLKAFHLPIKLPGSEVRIPDEYEQFIEVIELAFAAEQQINPELDDLYVTLTVDQTPVERGKLQRGPGWHVDDWQWGKFFPKQTIEQCYLVTSGPDTTEFAVQKFDLNGYDENDSSLISIFESQFSSKVHKAEPFCVYLMDGYCVHRSPITTIPGPRTLARVTFSPRIKAEVKRKEKTQNPFFGIIGGLSNSS